MRENLRISKLLTNKEKLKEIIDELLREYGEEGMVWSPDLDHVLILISLHHLLSEE